MPLLAMGLLPVGWSGQPSRVKRVPGLAVPLSSVWPVLAGRLSKEACHFRHKEQCRNPMKISPIALLALALVAVLCLALSDKEEGRGRFQLVPYDLSEHSQTMLRV